MTPSFPREFQPAVLRILHLIAGKLTPTGLSPSTAWHSSQLRLHFPDIRWSPTTPHPPCITARCSVWTLPLSVAPTNGIAFAFFSCGYSDVSFPRVPAPIRERPRRDRISHSGIPGSTAPCASPGLFAAWHALLRRPSRAIHRPGYSPEYAGPVCIWEQTSARHHMPKGINPSPMTLSSPGAQYMDSSGFEPEASASQRRRSSAELRALGLTDI